MRNDAVAIANAFKQLFPKKNENKQREVFKTEDDSNVILQQLRFAETIFPDSALTTCPISHPCVTYFSKNCEHILGHPHERLIEMDLTEFMALTHPEDLPYLGQCYDYMKSLEPYNPAEHRFSIYYRFRNAAGEYAHICNENLAIQTGSDAYLYIMVFSVAPSEAKFYHVKLDLNRKCKGKFKKVSTYNPRQTERLITPRQYDIVQLIAKGYANQEIAELLNVSIHTVKNHKQMLFKKINVKNSIELANYVRKELPSIFIGEAL